MQVICPFSNLVIGGVVYFFLLRLVNVNPVALESEDFWVPLPQWEL